MQIAESFSRVEDISHEHDAQIPSVVYQIVFVGIAAGHAVNDIREVHRLQRRGRDVVILISQRRVELTEADFELGPDFPGRKGVHYLYVLLTVSVRRAGDSVESLDLQPEIDLFGDLAVEKQPETFRLKRRTRTFVVRRVVPSRLQISGYLRQVGQDFLPGRLGLYGGGGFRSDRSGFRGGSFFRIRRHEGRCQHGTAQEKSNEFRCFFHNATFKLVSNKKVGWKIGSSVSAPPVSNPKQPSAGISDMELRIVADIRVMEFGPYRGCRSDVTCSCLTTGISGSG